MKSRYVSLRKNPAGSPENKKISYPGKGTRFGKHLCITYVKIEYTVVMSSMQPFNFRTPCLSSSKPDFRYSVEGFRNWASNIAKNWSSYAYILSLFHYLCGKMKQKHSVNGRRSSDISCYNTRHSIK